MPRHTLPTPPDFNLARDVCSYGYFLLAPNHWDVPTQTLSRVLTLPPKPGTRRESAIAVSISQPKGTGTPLTVRTNRAALAHEKPHLRAQLVRMLRLDDPTTTIQHFHTVDPRWKPSGRGRLFRSPTLFEDIIKTVTSCNVAWPNTITMNGRLCEVLGPKLILPKSSPQKSTAHGFPSATKVASTRVQTLRARCRVGYRDARMVALAKLLKPVKGQPSPLEQHLTDPSLPDSTLFNSLVDLPGIGPYAAANIMQLLGRYGTLPLDTESVRHGRVVMGLKGTPNAIMKRVKDHFAPFGAHAFRSYWFELWQFYESKRGPAHTWDRETTGRTFTAALLNER